MIPQHRDGVFELHERYPYRQKFAISHRFNASTGGASAPNFKLTHDRPTTAAAEPCAIERLIRSIGIEVAGVIAENGGGLGVRLRKERHGR
ncbi:MAG: hypothetical protein JWL84_3482 [Rhodospirillales bacterium]|jgi:hypothetical protein|nr:hypothetical protein [Rhodospirillales bacterium]